MRIMTTRYSFALSLLCLPRAALAGPPYVTDDPEPVPYRHWEFYLGTQHEIASDGAEGALSFLELNYGVAPNVQLHLIAPLAYARPPDGPLNYGPGDIELGAKIRFVRERNNVPMLGVFPLVELPVGSAAKGLGSGRLRAFMPLWLQKSFRPWTTYGGGGYWLNPGPGNRDYGFLGWQAQRRIGDRFALGGEIFYTTADRVGEAGKLRFNLGLTADFTQHHHLLASCGRGIAGKTLFLGYLAYQLTL
jgi:hypothetical protein